MHLFLRRPYKFCPRQCRNQNACVQVRDAGNLLTRAGFALPGVDVDEYVVKYRNGKHALYTV